MSAHKHPLGTVAELDEQDIKESDENLRGDLILPDSDEYEDARNVWNGLVNKYPAVVARAKGATDVARAIQFARDNGLELSIRGGAHHQAGSAIVNQGLVIDLEDMDSVHGSLMMCAQDDEYFVSVTPRRSRKRLPPSVML